MIILLEMEQPPTFKIYPYLMFDYDLMEGDLFFLQNFLVQAKGMGFGGSKDGQRTIIFSPRVCDNVDLEVGSLIRIHPPW
jgi:hypothetical protein